MDDLGSLHGLNDYLDRRLDLRPLSLLLVANGRVAGESPCGTDGLDRPDKSPLARLPLL